MPINKQYLREMARVHALGAADLARLEAESSRRFDRPGTRDAWNLLEELRAACDELALCLARAQRGHGLQKKVSVMLAEECAYRLNAGLQRAGQISASLELQKALDKAIAAFRRGARTGLLRQDWLRPALSSARPRRLRLSPDRSRRY
ncbi:MAG: hypothetical protein ABFS30_11450 [Pseudomonadota bacterium]